MINKDEEIRQMRARINGALTSRNDAKQQQRVHNTPVNGERVRVAVEELKEARKYLKRKTREWETDYYEEIIEDCVNANNIGNTGRVYKHLKLLGKKDFKTAPISTNITTDQFRDHFKKVTEKRFENTPEEIDEVVDSLKDRRGEPEAEEWKRILDKTPDRKEIMDQIGL